MNPLDVLSQMGGGGAPGGGLPSPAPQAQPGQRQDPSNMMNMLLTFLAGAGLNEITFAISKLANIAKDFGGQPDDPSHHATVPGVTTPGKPANPLGQPNAPNPEGANGAPGGAPGGAPQNPLAMLAALRGGG